MSSIHPLASMGRYDDAIAAAEAARKTFLTAGDNTLAARCDLNLGATHQRRGDAAAAVRAFDRARPLVQSDPVILAKLLSNRGHALIDLDRFDDAEESYRDALAVFVDRGVNWAAAIVEGNLAELATRQGRLRRAMYYFERARQRLERDEAPGEVARILAEQADAQEIVGLFDDARAGFEQALPTLDAHDLVVEAARARAGLGRVLLRLGRLDDADGPLRRAADEFEKLGQAVDKARTDLIRAELAAKLGDTDRADSLTTGALAALSDRPVETARALYRRAQTARQCGRIEPALIAAETAVQLAERFDVAPLLADLYHLRGALRVVGGAPADAIEDLRSAVKAVERVRGTLQSERFRAAFLGDRLRAYDDLAATLLESGGASAIEEVFRTVEQAKSRSLLDLVTAALDADTPAEEGALPGGLNEELSRVRSELNVFYSRLADASLGKSSPHSPDRIRDEIRAREQRLNSLESRLSSAGGVAALFARPAELEQVGAALPADTALIEYFSAANRLHALVIRDRTPRIFRNLIGVDEAGDRVRRVHFQIRRGLRPGATQGPRAARTLEDCRRELRAASDALIEPLRGVIAGAQRLRIVPHGPLHALPFAALWDGQRHLIEEFEIGEAPSASLLVHCASAAAAPARARRPLVVGVPDEAAPQIARETACVAAALRAERILTGPAATVAGFAEAASDADVIHIACHGHFSAENPMASGLKLHDRWLTVRDVYRLRLRATLVTLSGCETGRTVIGSGDELIGLVRAFLAAGAAAVLVSLWTVNDESTSELMSSFYGSWRATDAGRSVTVAAALRAAQIAMLPARPHPLHWAPFIVTGGA
jgi:tetratricopeptide (TPR) repeat protein